MKTKITKTISLVIVFTMLFSSVPFYAFATEDIKLESTEDEGKTITIGEAGG